MVSTYKHTKYKHIPPPPKNEHIPPSPLLIACCPPTQMVLIYKHIVFAVDDGQNMDLESWEFVPRLWANPGMMFVIVYKTASGYEEKAAYQAMRNATVTIDLPALQAEHMCPLACQVLGVVQIPERLETYVDFASFTFVRVVSKIRAKNLFNVHRKASANTASSLNNIPSHGHAMRIVQH